MAREEERQSPRLYICGSGGRHLGSYLQSGRWRRLVRCGWERREEGAQLCGGESGPMGICYPDLELRARFGLERWYRLLDRPMVWASHPREAKDRGGPRIAADPWEKQQPEG